MTNNGFSLSLAGALLGTGPLDALISFPKPLTVVYDGQDIAEISLPPICAAANSGVPNLQTNANLTITSQSGCVVYRLNFSAALLSDAALSSFTAFATYLLHNPGFTWTVTSTDVQVEALNIIFTGVSLSKDLVFKGFNNLPGVSIANFQLVSPCRHRISCPISDIFSSVKPGDDSTRRLIVERMLNL